jgi:sulfite exporter TauE/SafE
MILGVAVGLSFSFIKQIFNSPIFGFITGITFIVLGLLRATDSISNRSKVFLSIHKLATFMTLRISKIKKNSFKVFLTGMVSGFLPCGWLYGFVIAAASFADPIKSPLVLLFFWLGTIPIFNGLQFIKTHLTGLVSMQKTSSLLLITLGLFLLMTRTLGYGHSLIPRATFDQSLITEKQMPFKNPNISPICGE